MKMCEQIRNHRKALGLTQEQVAAYLGISAPAVNKWEKGNTYPDVTLLPVLARLLKIDMNELFSFREELTEFEIGQFANDIVALATEQGFDAAFEQATEKILEYPHCTSLIFMVATTLDGMLALSAVSDEDKENYKQTILEWLERVYNSSDDKIRCSATYLLAAKYLQAEDYKKAGMFLDELPDVPMDKTILQAKVMLHEKDDTSTVAFLESHLLQKAANLQNYLYLLIEIALQSGNYQKAEKIAAITDQTCSLFGLWHYGRIIPHLLIALAQKDEEKSISLIWQALEASQEPWDMSSCPLYESYSQKTFERIGNSFSKSFLSEIRQQEEYAFLRGNQKLEEIFAKFENK